MKSFLAFIGVVAIFAAGYLVCSFGLLESFAEWAKTLA